jgi:hypothetical protein
VITGQDRRTYACPADSRKVPPILDASAVIVTVVVEQDRTESRYGDKGFREIAVFPHAPTPLKPCLLPAHTRNNNVSCENDHYQLPGRMDPEVKI